MNITNKDTVGIKEDEKGYCKRENKQRIGIKGHTREIHPFGKNDSYNNNKIL